MKAIKKNDLPMEQRKIMNRSDSKNKRPEPLNKRKMEKTRSYL